MASRQQNEEDRKANLHELADQFGEGVGNAEELINANAARRTAEIATISALPILQDETNDLDLEKVKADEGLYVVDAAWRGSGRTKGLVATAEDEGGRLHKVLIESSIDQSRQTGPRRSSHAKNEQGEDPQSKPGDSK